MLMSSARARGECGFNFLDSWSYSIEWVWDLGTKSMWHYFRKVKCQLGDTSGSSLLEFNVNLMLEFNLILIGYSRPLHVSGLVVSTTGFKSENPRSFPCRANLILACVNA